MAALESFQLRSNHVHFEINVLANWVFEFVAKPSKILVAILLLFWHAVVMMLMACHRVGSVV